VGFNTPMQNPFNIPIELHAKVAEHIHELKSCPNP